VSFAAFAAFIELNAFSSNIQPNFSQYEGYRVSMPVVVGFAAKSGKSQLVCGGSRVRSETKTPIGDDV
jgi:hypothetical protein